MSVERDRAGEGFLARWSRLKTAPVEEVVPPALDTERVAAAAEAQADEAPPLPPVEELTIESDFRGFLHPKVNEDVRRAALRKLFSDPHFNVMDGLDVYIDDYSKADPIPPEMLASLTQAQRILKWASETKEDPAPAAAENIDPPKCIPEGEAESLSAPAAEAPSQHATRHSLTNSGPVENRDGSLHLD